jgi:hypothetical protein
MNMRACQVALVAVREEIAEHEVKVGGGAEVATGIEQGGSSLLCEQRTA